MSIVVVMPTRGRPEAASKTMQSFLDTAARVDTSLVIAVDSDDPTLMDYRFIGPRPVPYTVNMMTLQPYETGNLVKATNSAVDRIMRSAEPGDIIANIGDDHRFRTHGWDKIIRDALVKPGIAYGDDLFQRENLPTAPFISYEVIKALGYYAEPGLKHMYIDNVWKDIGRGIGNLVYLPEVVIEHVHPQAPNRKNAAPWDDQYLSYNNDQFKNEEQQAYLHWRTNYMSSEIERVKNAL